jgi:hypothetical protein
MFQQRVLQYLGQNRSIFSAQERIAELETKPYTKFLRWAVLHWNDDTKYI